MYELGNQELVMTILSSASDCHMQYVNKTDADN